MTNERFKALYEDALMHGWVTSKDPTKAAEQKKKQQEYNHQYYLKNKNKWNKETESQGLSTGPRTARFRDEIDRKENASALARQAIGDIRRQEEEAKKREEWEEKQRKKRVQELAQNARREIGTKDLKKNESKAMEESARRRNQLNKNRQETDKRRNTESNAMARSREQQSTRNRVKNRQIKESNAREEAFRTSSNRRKTRSDALAKRLARNSTYIKVGAHNRSGHETKAKEDNAKTRRDRRSLRDAQSKVSEQYAANAKRRTVNSFKNDKSANEAAAYAITRSLERQVRKQKRGQSSYPSKTTPRNKKNKGPK